MRRQRLLAALAALAAIAVVPAASSCGVPGRTGVVVDRDGEGRDGLIEDSYGGEGPAPGPEGVGNIEEFVGRFLEAPGGDWEGAADRVKAFLDPQLQPRWQAPPNITVVRLVSGKPEIKGATKFDVTLTVQQIGVLSDNGVLGPPQSTTDTYTFTVGPTTAARGGLAVVSDPPPVMLLTDTGLNRWYERRTIYFWAAGRHNLVADLRYLPKAVEDVSRPNLLIDWLIKGPAEWLQGSVQDLPDGTKQLARAYKDNSGRLIVNLNNAATVDNGLDQLLAQLCWSLRADFTGDLVLQIESQKRAEGSSADYVELNPTYRLTNQEAQQFAVAGGVVRRVKVDDVSVPADVPLPPEVNKNVRFAAISDEYAALARRDGDELQLWVGSTEQGRFRRANLRASDMSRPVLTAGNGTGYVAAHGRLYQFSVDTAKASEVTVPGLPGGVTSVALAPDGRRLAVVASGMPYLVGLSGEGGGSTQGTRLVPAPLGGLTGISWLNETSLALTGPNKGKPTLFSVSVDGVLSAQQELNVTTVTEVVAFPEDPVTSAHGKIMVEADNATYEVFSSTIQYLPPEKLAGPPPAKGVVPTAPFFLE